VGNGKQTASANIIYTGGKLKKTASDNNVSTSGVLSSPPVKIMFPHAILSAFRTREDRQPTSKFVVACPCPDGLMQDGTQEGNEAYVISHRGAHSRGYKRRARERGRERERERERVSACCLSRLPRLSSMSNVDLLHLVHLP
jgi:hypothetical protein